MTRKILFLLFGTVAIAACQQNTPRYVNDDVITYEQFLGYVPDPATLCQSGRDGTQCVSPRAGAMPAQNAVKVAPDGGNLYMETDKYVIEIQGNPTKKYNYYIWTGNATYDDAPDVIVNDGVPSVLVQQ